MAEKEVLMGAYIMVGVTTKLVIDKKSLEGNYQGLLKQEHTALELLSEHMDISLFNIVESKKTITLSILPEVFTAHIRDFLQEQCAMIYEPGNAHVAEVLALIEGKSFNDMMSIASSGSPPFYFQRHESYGYRDTYLLKAYDVWFEMIMYFMQGKAVLECYNRLFSYIGALVRKASCNPLKGAVMVDLD